MDECVKLWGRRVGKERSWGGLGGSSGRGGRDRVRLEKLGKVAEKTLFLQETSRVADTDQRAQQFGCKKKRDTSKHVHRMKGEKEGVERNKQSSLQAR